MKSFTVFGIALCWLVAISSSQRTALSFDPAYSPPKDWRLVEDGKWGLRVNVPPSVDDAGISDGSLWIHEGSNLRVIIDFNKPPSSESLKRRKSYSEARLRIHGLPALLCAYDEPATRGGLNKVVALFFLETRTGLGSPTNHRIGWNIVRNAIN